MRVLLAVLLASTSFHAQADIVDLLCTITKGAHSGQSFDVAFSEKQQAIAIGTSLIPARFTTGAIHWQQAGSQYRLDRRDGGLWMQFQRYPFERVGHCTAAAHRLF